MAKPILVIRGELSNEIGSSFPQSLKDEYHTFILWESTPENKIVIEVLNPGDKMTDEEIEAFKARIHGLISKLESSQSSDKG